MKYFILIATVAMVTEIVPMSRAIMVKETNSFNTIIYLINPIPGKIMSNS